MTINSSQMIPQLREEFERLLTFDNGEKRVFDLKPYFDKPVFAKLKNEAMFKNVKVVSGSVEWQGEIDLSYDTLYLESKAVKTVQRKSTRGQKKNLGMVAVQKKKSQARVAVK
jgi:hypothetical protein